MVDDLYELCRRLIEARRGDWQGALDDFTQAVGEGEAAANAVLARYGAPAVLEALICEAGLYDPG